MKKHFPPLLLLSLLAFSCSDTKTEKDGTDSVTVVIGTDTTETLRTVDSIPPNSEVVDSLLKKPVTTPANNPFGLKPGDNLITSGALDKEPLKSRLKTILGDNFDAYKKSLKTAKGLKKDSDGFLYTSGMEAKGSKNQAFFLYQHEKDVLFLGLQDEANGIRMMNDMKSRLFAPETVDEWAARPLE